MAGSQYTQWEALDRAGTVRKLILYKRNNFTPNEYDVKKMLDHVNPEHHLRSMIGYHLAWESSLVGMVMVQGKQREVVNIGLGIKQVAVEPRDATVSAYVESLSHKVCSTRSLPQRHAPRGPCRCLEHTHILTPHRRPFSSRGSRCPSSRRTSATRSCCAGCASCSRSRRRTSRRSGNRSGSIGPGSSSTYRRRRAAGTGSR